MNMDLFANGIDLHLLIDMLRRRLWIAVILFSVIFTTIVSLIKFLPNIYTSSALILVEGQQIPQEYVRSTVTMGLERRLQTISQEILSRSRLEQLIEQFRLYADLKEQGNSGEVVAAAMRRDIGIEVRGRRSGIGGDTVAFEIRYTSPDPQKAMQVATALASLYIEENLKVRSEQSEGTSKFLRAELEEVNRKLEAQEQKVVEYKRQYMGELPEQLQSNLSTLSLLQKQLEVLSEGLAKAQDRRSLLIRRTADADAIAQGSVLNADAAPVRIETLRRTLAQLKTRFSDKHPDVIRLKQEIAALEGYLKSQSESAQLTDNASSLASSNITPSFQVELATVDAEIRRLTVDLSKIRSDIVIYQQRIENTPEREQELLSLTRNYASTRDLHASLLKRLEEANLADSLEQRQKAERFRLLEPASYPTEPTAPKRMRFFILGLALSLGAAAGGVLLWEILDTSFHRVADIKAFTKYPILASIPQITTEQDQSRGRRRRYLGAAALAMSLVMLAFTSYWVATGNESLVRRLFTQSSSGTQFRQ